MTAQLYLIIGSITPKTVGFWIRREGFRGLGFAVLFRHLSPFAEALESWKAWVALAPMRPTS